LVSVVAAFCILTSLEEKGMFNLGLPTFDIPGLSFLEETANAYLGESGLGLDKDEEGNGPVAAAGGVEVHFLDVGQAQSVFIRGPKKTALIDAGENNQGGDVLQYLEKQGVTKLDYVIGTHPHSDHIGGLDTVIAGMEVGAVILPEIPGEIVPATVTYTDLLEAIDAKGLRITQAVPGKTYSLGGGATLAVLAPLAEYADLNNMSVCSRLDYGETSFLFTGDAEKEAEATMLERDARLAANVLDAGHHGSGTSTSQAFLDAVSPSVAVISCGLDNSYGHPHREVMERLQAMGVTVYRTDLNGAVVVTSDGDSLSVQTEK